MMKLGVKNFLMVGVMAVLFIVMAKVIVNKYPAFNFVAPAVNAV